jgi:hypothetical protein
MSQPGRDIQQEVQDILSNLQDLDSLKNLFCSAFQGRKWPDILTPGACAPFV